MSSHLETCTCEYHEPARWGHAGETPDDPDRVDDSKCPIHGEFAVRLRRSMQRHARLLDRLAGR